MIMKYDYYIQIIRLIRFDFKINNKSFKQKKNYYLNSRFLGFMAHQSCFLANCYLIIIMNLIIWT